MRVILFWTMLLTSAALADAHDITIRGISRARASGWVNVDNGWLRNTDVMEVKFTVKFAISGKIPVQWGFFDADKKLLKKFSQLPRLQAKGDDYQELPETLEPNRTYTLSFPIPPSLASGAARWRVFSVALGEPAATAIFPGTDETGDFALGEHSRSRTQVAASDIKPTIKRISRYKNGLSAMVDGHWVRGLNTLKVTVQLDSGAEAENFGARIYLYDAEKRPIFEWKAPPQVSIGGGTYTSLPASWKNGESYEIHFPIPEEYERGPNPWRTAVAVFGNGSVVTAESYPASGKVADYEFPEKAGIPAP